jgi:hypothetical protein
VRQPTGEGEDGGFCLFYPTAAHACGRDAQNERDRETHRERRASWECSAVEGPSGVSTGTTKAKAHCAVTSVFRSSDPGCEYRDRGVLPRMRSYRRNTGSCTVPPKTC